MLRSSSRMLVAAATAAAAAVALLSVRGVEATESLTFVRPVTWAAQFNYNGVEGQMYAEPVRTSTAAPPAYFSTSPVPG
jgi:hypothetical protein